MNLVVVVLILTGWASQYDPGIMSRVVVTRQAFGALPTSLPSVDGFVAVEDCGRIGEVILIRPQSTVEWERFLIVDCAGGEETHQWMLRNNILVEVDHETATRWNTVGKGIRIEVLVHRKLSNRR